MNDRAEVDLVDILQLAYSGELAAAYAYRGHARSVSRVLTRIRIERIEQDEWHHRRLVGEILSQLGRAPRRAREARAALVGRTLGLLCHVMGRLLPMYAAGRLESHNIREYEAAARHAAACNHFEFVDCLLTMAETEWDHEAYFRSCVLGHWLSSRLRLWPLPPPREEIRESFRREAATDPSVRHPPADALTPA